MISPDNHPWIGLPKGLAGKGGAFEGDLVGIHLREDLFVYLVADGPFSEGMILICLGLGKAVLLYFVMIHMSYVGAEAHIGPFVWEDTARGDVGIAPYMKGYRFFLTGAFPAGFFGAALLTGFLPVGLPFAGALGGGAV